MMMNMKQKIVLEVLMPDTRCKTRARKIAAITEGMTSMVIDEAKNQIVIVGVGIDTPDLATKLRKKVGRTTIISIEEVKSEEKKKEEEAAKKKKEEEAAKKKKEEEDKKKKEEEDKKKKEQEAKRKEEEEEAAKNGNTWSYNNYYNSYARYPPPPPPVYEVAYYGASDYPRSWFS